MKRTAELFAYVALGAALLLAGVVTVRADGVAMRPTTTLMAMQDF
jgi:hypothetical protein